MRDDGKTKAQLIAELTCLRVQFEKVSRQEEELRASEERYRNFVENAVDGCEEFDLNGRCTFCNKAIYTLVGCTREEYMQRRLQDRFATQEEADRVIAAFRENQRTGKTTDLTFAHLVCNDGTTKVIEASISLIRDADGKATGFRSITRDLTDRKKIEEERERYRTLSIILMMAAMNSISVEISFFAMKVCRESLVIPATNF